MDLALVNGIVHSDSTRAAAVLIREPLITAVGGTSDILDQAPRGTVVVDLAGRHVLPAFTDSHTHYHRAAVLRMHFLDFTTLEPRSVGDILTAVQGAAAALPPGQWVQGDNLSAAALAEGRAAVQGRTRPGLPRSPCHPAHRGQTRY